VFLLATKHGTLHKTTFLSDLTIIMRLIVNNDSNVIALGRCACYTKKAKICN